MRKLVFIFFIVFLLPSLTGAAIKNVSPSRGNMQGSEFPSQPAFRYPAQIPFEYLVKQNYSFQTLSESYRFLFCHVLPGQIVPKNFHFFAYIEAPYSKILYPCVETYLKGHVLRN